MYSKYASNVYISDMIVVSYTNGYTKSILYIKKNSFYKIRILCLYNNTKILVLFICTDIFQLLCHVLSPY